MDGLERMGRVGNAGLRGKETRRPRILLVDDDPVFRGVMVRLAERSGFEVEAYESMLEIEPFTLLSSFDGAIFDYHLGHQMDGIDVVSHLKPFFARIPTLLVSADDSVASVLGRSPTCGFTGFISKSAGALKILERMSELVTHRVRASRE